MNNALIITIALLGIFAGCISTLPVMDANLMETNLSVGGRYTIRRDEVKIDPLISREAKLENGTALYNFPVNFVPACSFKGRIEIGYWILGGYTKVLIIKPVEYTHPSLDNVAVSAYIAANEAGLILGEHLIEELLEGGFLVGTPLCSFLSLSTGLTINHSFNGINNMYFAWAPDMEDSLKDAQLYAIREKIVVPVNLTARFSFGTLRMFAFLNGNIPVDINERYFTSLTYENGTEKESEPPFINHINGEIRFGLGLFLNGKKK